MFEAEQRVAEVLILHLCEGRHLLYGHRGVQLQVGAHDTYLHLLLHLVQEYLGGGRERGL